MLVQCYHGDAQIATVDKATTTHMCEIYTRTAHLGATADPSLSDQVCMSLQRGTPNSHHGLSHQHRCISAATSGLLPHEKSLAPVEQACENCILSQGLL